MRQTPVRMLRQAKNWLEFYAFQPAAKKMRGALFHRKSTPRIFVEPLLKQP